MLRRRERGLTLIEILLALVVMGLGVIGILALFPPALQSSRESMEDTNAAILAESIAHALKNAIQFATYDSATKKWTVVMTHDLKSATQVVRYTFNLPPLPPKGDQTQWYHYPSMGSPDPGRIAVDPAADPHFELGSDVWVHLAVEEVKKTDPTDPYKQFAFSFDVRKIHTLEYLEGTPSPSGQPYTREDLEPLVKLYEFRINIFRLQPGSQPDKALLALVTNRVSAR